jgi:hypothetical protein
MTGSGIPIRREATVFLVDGAKRRQGVVLLNSDGLAAMTTRLALSGMLLGLAVFIAVGFSLFPSSNEVAIACAFGLAGEFAGRFIGRGLATRRAARKAASGDGGITVIPFDSIVGFQVRPTAAWYNRPFKYKDLLVKTADGTEYEFRAVGSWQADFVSAMTARGSKVQSTSRGMLVTGQVTHLPA